MKNFYSPITSNEGTKDSEEDSEQEGDEQRSGYQRKDKFNLLIYPDFLFS